MSMEQPSSSYTNGGHGALSTPSKPSDPVLYPLLHDSAPPASFDAADLHPYPHQVAGHGLHTSDGLLTFRPSDGRCRVLKPLSRKLKGYVEVAFYRHIQRHGSSLQPFLPRCDGIAVVPSPTPSPPLLYLVLEDLTSAFSRPCVLDLKMGTQTFDEAASPQKMATEVAKFPHQSTIGCRVAGLRTFHPSTSSHTTRSKEWCRALTPASLPEAITAWLSCDGERPIPQLVVSSLLTQLRGLHRLMAHQTDFRFYSSSLLLTFDAGSEGEEARVCMIDFTHTFGPAREQWMADLLSSPPDGLQSAVDGWRAGAEAEQPTERAQQRVDVGYVIGLETIIRLLEGVAKSAAADTTDNG